MDPKQLKQLRKDIGLSLAGAASQVHVTTRTWARYESGDRQIPEGVIHLFFIQNKLKYPPK